jgi:uncharacterized protein involved in exopolysaccharide biosynthesis
MESPRTAISLRELCHTPFKHKRKIALVFACVMVVAVGVIALMPRAYRSQAKLFIRLGRENASLDPTATIGQSPVVAVPNSRENDVNSAVEILTSRFLIEQVVDSVGPDPILGRGELALMPSADTPAREPSSAKLDPERTLAVVKLTRKLDVENVKKSNIISIRYDGPSPEVSQAVVSRLIDCYIQRYAHLHRTPRAHQFMAEQMTRLQAQLGQTEEALRALKERTGLYSPESQRQLLVARAGQLEDDLLRTASSKAAALAEVKTLRSRLAQTPKTQVLNSTTGFPNAVSELMRGQLFTLGQKELELLSRRGEAHRDVDLSRKQISAAQEALAKEEQGREQVTVGPSRTYEEAQVSLLHQEALLASLEGRTDELRQQRDRQRALLQAINRDELSITRLERELELQNGQYRRYADNLEQAKIDQKLEAEGISNISVVQPATYDVEPIRPRPFFYLGLAMIVAVISSLGLAVLAEKLDRTLKTPEEAETVLGLPVLACVPHIRPRSAITNGKGRFHD